MSKIHAAALSVLISLPWSLAVAQTQGASGIIEGTVLNEKDEPVTKALVSVDDGMPTIGVTQYVPTDEKGYFTIDHLAWGNYKVFAKKESEGYPDISWAFYSNNVFQSVSLSEASPNAEVTIRIGPPCAVLRYSARDASTGRTLDAGITLRRASNPSNFTSGTHESNEVLVPSLTDVLAEVYAKGYAPWPPVKIKLKPHEEFTLNVKLQPSSEQ